jgi:pilus assembly protein Flp/PilA
MDGDPISTTDVVQSREFPVSERAMETVRKAAVSFFAEEDAATAVEYAVMLALIVAVCIGSVNVLAVNTGQSFNESSDAIASAFAN